MLYESALIPSVELGCLLATYGSYPKVLTFAQPSCRAECTTASGFAGQPAECRIRGALLPDGLTPTERQLLAEAAVEGPTGERRMQESVDQQRPKRVYVGRIVGSWGGRASPHLEVS